MGVLILLCGFFLLFPAVALAALLLGATVAGGIVAGCVSLAGGIATALVAAALPAGVAKAIRTR
jgi:hypothetical protein